MSTTDPEVRRRILVVDAQPLFRDGVKAWIAQQPDLECCGEADHAAAIHRAVATQRPDLAVLDLRLRGDLGFDLIKSLHAAFPNLPLVVVSTDDEVVYGERALRAGARGYVMKNQTGAELMQAVRTVLAGEIHTSKALADLMIKKLWRGESGGDPTTRLSDRELQVFRMLGAGMGTRQVAQRLHLSIKTVETYREHIKQKLELKDAPSLMHAAATWVGGS